MKRIFAAVLCLAIFSAGCGPRMRPAAVPIDKVFYGSSENTSTVVVFLPGREDDVNAFECHGFVDAIRQQNISADMVAVDAHLGYYAEKTLADRMKQDVIGPARSAGYDRIWLAGVSMGSLGALLYLKHHPEEIDGVILIGPYLGDNEIIDEIRNAGGLAAWTPGDVGADDWQRTLWKGLRDMHGKKLPPIYLAYGKDDRYAGGAELFAPLLPADRVSTVPGGHDWRTWHTLWKRFLARNVL
ncbi:MAG: hypothetical protein OHK006_14320 [Thermodesulfovibrionales bacterium]